MCSNSLFILSDTANVTMKAQWLGGGGEKSGRLRGQTRFTSYIATSLIIRLLSARYAIQTRSAYSSSSSLPVTEYEGAMNMNSRLLSPDQKFALTTLSQGTLLNARRTERPTGGDDYLGFVLAGPAPGVNAVLRVVRKNSLWAERRIDEESMPGPVRKHRLVE